MSRLGGVQNLTNFTLLQYIYFHTKTQSFYPLSFVALLPPPHFGGGWEEVVGFKDHFFGLIQLVPTATVLFHFQLCQFSNFRISIL